MKTPENSRNDAADQFEYQYVEYESGSDTVAVIQDRENESAWVQSTVSVSIDP